ncbi:MAG: hypothetical protein QG622_146 [Actinomycetota bacterium]|nr:hypothetical protein [Actinomycetota bacterium]
MAADLSGRVGMVTTTIPVGGLGEVRLPFGGGTSTYSAYSSNRGVPIPTGTRVTVVEHLTARTLVVSADA